MKKGWFFIFLGLFLLPSLVFASVIINEVAWMGTAISSTDEWIELYNNGSTDIDLTNWSLQWRDGKYGLVFTTEKCTNVVISAGGYFLLERTDDTTVPNIAADCIYTGALSNSGEYLILKNAQNPKFDYVDGSDNWKIGGGEIIGNNTTKETAQRSGSLWITATGTPKAQNASVSIESGGSSSGEQTSSSSSSANEESSYIPPENLPKIKAYAGEDKTVVAGAAVEFRGQAFGLKDEPLDNARFLWSFGDGASKEGRNITHVYQYPGEYIVILNVSSGEYAASDYLLIKAGPNQLSISESKPGFGGWIELYNGSKEQIDISGCQLKSGNQIFIFPKSTLIRPNTYLVIPISVSGVVLAEGKGVIELLYPGGFKAGEFYYEGLLKDGESFSFTPLETPFLTGFTRDSKVGLITKETPGEANLIPQVKTNVLPQEKPASVAEGQSSENQKASSKEVASQEKNNQDIKKETDNVTASAVNASPSNNKIYYFAVLGLIIFAIAAVLFIRRHGDA